jgi:hypothetical protein
MNDLHAIAAEAVAYLEAPTPDRRARIESRLDDLIDHPEELRFAAWSLVRVAGVLEQQLGAAEAADQLLSIADRAVPWLEKQDVQIEARIADQQKKKIDQLARFTQRATEIKRAPKLERPQAEGTIALKQLLPRRKIT